MFYKVHTHVLCFAKKVSFISMAFKLDMAFRPACIHFLVQSAKSWLNVLFFQYPAHEADLKSDINKKKFILVPGNEGD